MCYETAQAVRLSFQGTQVTGFRKPFWENLYTYYEFLSKHMH